MGKDKICLILSLSIAIMVHNWLKNFINNNNSTNKKVYTVNTNISTPAELITSLQNKQPNLSIPSPALTSKPATLMISSQYPPCPTTPHPLPRIPDPLSLPV